MSMVCMRAGDSYKFNTYDRCLDSSLRYTNLKGMHKSTDLYVFFRAWFVYCRAVLKAFLHVALMISKTYCYFI